MSVADFLKRWLLFSADRRRFFAACPELASDDVLRCGRDFPGQRDAFLVKVDAGRRHDPGQRLGVWMKSPFDDVVGSAQFHDAPEVENGDPVGYEPCQRQVVCNEQIGQFPLLPEFHHQFQYPRTDGCVQHGHRLVCHDKIGVHDHGSCDDDPLPLASGKLVRIAVQKVSARRHPGLFQRKDDPLFPLLCGTDKTVHVKGLGDNIQNEVPGIERLVWILKDHLRFLAESLHIFSIFRLHFPPLKKTSPPVILVSCRIAFPVSSCRCRFLPPVKGSHPFRWTGKRRPQP